MAELRLHLLSENKEVVPSSACRTYGHTTDDPLAVTCLQCRRTLEWRRRCGDSSIHASQMQFWPREGVRRGKSGSSYRMCGAADTEGTTVLIFSQLTCPHCIDAILDTMVATRARVAGGRDLSARGIVERWIAEGSRTCDRCGRPLVDGRCPCPLEMRLRFAGATGG